PPTPGLRGGASGCWGGAAPTGPPPRHRTHPASPRPGRSNPNPRSDRERVRPADGPGGGGAAVPAPPPPVLMAGGLDPAPRHTRVDPADRLPHDRMGEHGPHVGQGRARLARGVLARRRSAAVASVRARYAVRPLSDRAVLERGQQPERA